MTSHLINQVRAAVDIRALISGHVKLTMRGRTGWGRCPFHSEKSASFAVNLPGHKHAGLWRCHGCGEHGDAFDFVIRTEGLSDRDLPSVVRRLASDAGIEMEGFRPESVAERLERLRVAEERHMCAWWFRQAWKAHRSALDRILAEGPPEIGSLAEAGAEYHGQMMRYAERHFASEEGMRVFRLARSQSVDGMYYRDSVETATRLERRNEEGWRKILGLAGAPDQAVASVSP